MSFLNIQNLGSVPARQIIKNLIKIFCDLSAILLSFYIAHYIVLFPPESRLLIDGMFIAFIALFNSYFLEIHNHLWRTISLYNFRHIAKYAISIGILYAVWCVFYNSSGEDIFKFTLVFLLISFGLLSLARICVRIVNEKNKQLYTDDKTKIVLIGAGKGGELFLREARKKQHLSYEIEGILDDDPELWGKRVFGYKVYGPIKDLPKLASNEEVTTVTIAIPSIDRSRLLEITQMCEELNLHVKILPTFSKLITLSELFPEQISVENLLGRDSIELKNEEVFSFIRNKTVMVTGAGGSIGSEVCRQIIELQPKKLILVDHSEHNLYTISWDLEHKFNFRNHIPCIGSVTDQSLMESIFEEHKPNIVFHAAAYKHVPLLEGQAKQAIQNNFFGTRIVAELSSKYKSEKFILISTDKAVNSTNIMGTTKRMAEIFCQSLNEEGNTKFITVRFGNVLDSAGSVVPLFKKQLKQGGPITVTHPEITRFFMSIPEASQLVLEASAMGKGGEIFVLDMGEPVKIVTLAERIITLSGKRPYKDIDIVYTGLRPGEKLYEELFYKNEEHIPTSNKKILLAQTISANVPKIAKFIPELERCIMENDIEQLLEYIKALVPEAKIRTETVPKQRVNSF